MKNLKSITRRSAEADQFVLLHSLLQGPNPLQLNCYEDFQSDSDSESAGSNPQELMIITRDSQTSNKTNGAKRWDCSKAAQANPNFIVAERIRKRRSNARAALMRRSTSLRSRSVGSYHNSSASFSKSTQTRRTNAMRRASSLRSVGSHNKEGDFPDQQDSFNKSTGALTRRGSTNKCKTLGRSSSLRSLGSKRSSSAASFQPTRSSRDKPCKNREDDDASWLNESSGDWHTVISHTTSSSGVDESRSSRVSCESHGKTSSRFGSSRIGAIRERHAVRRCNSGHSRIRGGETSIKSNLKRSNTAPTTTTRSSTTTNESVDPFLCLVTERHASNTGVDTLVKRQPVERFRKVNTSESNMTWERPIQCHSVSSELTNWLK